MTYLAFLTDLFKNVCVSCLPLSEMRCSEKFAKIPVETVILSMSSVAGCTVMFTCRTFKGRLAMLNIIDYFCFGAFFCSTFVCTFSSILFTVHNLLFFFFLDFICLCVNLFKIKSVFFCIFEWHINYCKNNNGVIFCQTLQDSSLKQFIRTL